jgi:hypothetical protein
MFFPDFRQRPASWERLAAPPEKISQFAGTKSSLPGSQTRLQTSTVTIPNHPKIMKLLLSSFFAAFLCAPLAFSAECDKCKDKEKKEETTLAGKCKDGECDKDEDPALAGKCKDGECDKDEDPALAGKCKDGECDKDEDPALAHCGKCKKDKEHEEEEEKKEGTLAGKCKDGECDKDEDPALAHCGKCKKDKEHEEEEEKKEGTLA